MKVLRSSPVWLYKPGLSQTLVHTGQHFDAAMSEIFLEQLDMPAPDVNMEVGIGEPRPPNRGNHDAI